MTESGPGASVAAVARPQTVLAVQNLEVVYNDVIRVPRVVSLENPAEPRGVSCAR